MPQPTPYDRQFNFDDWQMLFPATPLPANQVELEYNAIKITIDEILSNLGLIQRDDGELANLSVGFDQLMPEVQVGVNPATQWITGAEYGVGDAVFVGSDLYRALVSHSAGVFATDLAALKWLLIGAFSAGGVTDGDKGDIIVSGSGAVWTLDTTISSPHTFTGVINFSDQAIAQNLLVSQGSSAGFKLGDRDGSGEWIIYANTGIFRIFENGSDRFSITEGTGAVRFNAYTAGVVQSDGNGNLTVLPDPNADRLVFWDDSAGAIAYLTLGTNLSITGTTINATGGGAPGDGDYGDVVVSGSGTIWTIDTNVVGNTKFRQGIARSVVGVTGNALSNVADIQGATDQVLRINGAGTALAFGAVDVSKAAAVTGILLAAAFPALTGDITTAGGALATTLATVNANVGTFGSATQVGQFTVNAKGLITAASNISITAPTPTVITVANEATDTTCFPAFFTAATGDLGPKTNAFLTYNSNTGAFSIGTAAPLTAGTIELGAAADTTLARVSAGLISVEGVTVVLVSGAQSLSSKTLVSPIITTSPTAAGATWTDLGTVTTADINGGTLDGTVIGGAAAAAATVTALIATASALVGHTAALAIGGNTDINETFGTTAASGGMALGMFNATAGTAAHFDFYRSKNAAIGSATVVASGDGLGSINWFGAQQTGTFATQNMAAQIRAEVDGTVTSGAGADMPGRLVFATTADAAGAVTDRLILDAAGIFKPNTNDGVALGTGALAFSDLFLASGGVINFNAGNYTITHTAGLLTTNGNLSIGTAGVFTTGTIELGAAADTTLARVSAGVVSIEGSNILTALTGQPLDATLTALAAYNTNGLLTQTAADTFTGRTITGTAARIAVTSGSGVAGNPTIDIDSAYVGQSTITTLGTITTGVWTGTDIAFANIAQGLARSVLGVTGNAGADVASIQGTADQVLVVNGAGTALAFGTVATAGITNDAVTYAKMQNISTTSRVLGRATAGAGDTEELTLTQVLDFIGSAAQGDILYRGAASWERLPAGTSTQFLKSGGAAANPSWSTPSGSGDFVGPASSTDNAIVRFDGTTGKLGQNSLAIVDDSGNLIVASPVGAGGVAIVAQAKTDVGDYASQTVDLAIVNPDATPTTVSLFAFGAEGVYSDVASLSAYDFNIFNQPLALYSLIVDGSTNNVGISTGGGGTADRRLHVEQESSATNTVTPVLRLTSTSSGTPAAGIGVGMEFEVETAAANNEVGATIEAVTTAVTAAAENFDLVFKSMKNGAAATERGRAEHIGQYLHQACGGI